MGRPAITDWDAAPLGDVSDVELAARLCCSPGTVRRHRERRGILPHGYYDGLCRIDWAAVDWEAGESDAAIGRRLGCSTATVLSARRRAGAPPVRWLGHRGIDWDDEPLGQETDEVIARRLGVDHGAVASARRVRGIPRVPSREVDWDAAADLGRTWDEDVAEAHGVGPETVAAARRRRGIAPYSERRTCACGREFTARSRRHRYCGTLCRGAGADARLRLGFGEDMEPLHVALVALRRELVSRLGGGRRDRRG